MNVFVNETVNQKKSICSTIKIFFKNNLSEKLCQNYSSGNLFM